MKFLGVRVALAIIIVTAAQTHASGETGLSVFFGRPPEVIRQIRANETDVRRHIWKRWEAGEWYYFMNRSDVDLVSALNEVWRSRDLPEVTREKMERALRLTLFDRLQDLVHNRNRIVIEDDNLRQLYALERKLSLRNRVKEFRAAWLAKDRRVWDELKDVSVLNFGNLRDFANGITRGRDPETAAALVFWAMAGMFWQKGPRIAQLEYVGRCLFLANYAGQLGPSSPIWNLFFLQNASDELILQMIRQPDLEVLQKVGGFDAPQFDRFLSQARAMYIQLRLGSVMDPRLSGFIFDSVLVGTPAWKKVALSAVHSAELNLQTTPAQADSGSVRDTIFRTTAITVVNDRARGSRYFSTVSDWLQDSLEALDAGAAMPGRSPSQLDLRPRDVFGWLCDKVMRRK